MSDNSAYQPGPAMPDIDRAARLDYVSDRGERIDYEARVRLVAVPRSDEDRRPVGRMSITSFTRLFDGKPDRDRPVLAMFNGGPIVASTALLLSGIGPKRAAFSDDLDAPLRDSYRLEDSPHAVLADCDLIVMDAIGCGYGRYEADIDVKSKYGAREDARQFAEAAAAWMSEEGREASPLYILGESYGTVRAPLMAKTLLELGDTTIAPAGVVLMGTTTNIQEVHDRLRSVLAPASSLPLMAAVAWYHHRGSLDATDWREAIDKARDYAYGPYLHALVEGSRLPADERAKTAAELERIAGLKAADWLKNRLNISKDRFRSMLLADEGKVVGVYDARYAAPASPNYPVDPSSSRVEPVLAVCAHRFYNDLLGVDRSLTRVEAPGDVWSAWDWSIGGPSDSVPAGEHKSPFDEFDYAGALEYCLQQVPGFRLMVVNGAYDTITTVGASDALIASIDAPEGTVTQRIYPAGHMTYTDRESGEALARDLAAFVRGE
ncbi:S10 family serine carboxypeptidase-like protein [Bifidobacterium jacchi]|nr:hypothetical protein [Bifidobacterium jacchi]